MRKPITHIEIQNAMTIAIVVMLTILLIRNSYLLIDRHNRTGSGHPDEIMKRGYFRSPGEGEETATAPQEQTAENTSATTEENASESDEQPEGEEE